MALTVELPSRWIPGACPGPRSRVRRNDDAYRHAGLDPASRCRRIMISEKTVKSQESKNGDECVGFIEFVELVA